MASKETKCQWVCPLSEQEAVKFGTVHDAIDHHPNSDAEKGITLFYQTPNVPKYELVMLLGCGLLNEVNGNHNINTNLNRRQLNMCSCPQPQSVMCQIIQLAPTL